MRQAPFMRFDEIFAGAQAVLSRVDYLRKQATLGDDDTDRVTIIEGLGAIATALAGTVSQWSGPVTCTVQSGEAQANRLHAAYDLVSEITVVADAQLLPLLSQAPKFQLPKRSSGGGAMSMSMRDPVQEAIDAATPRVITALPLVEFALTAGSFFPADKPSGKFFSYLFAHKPAAADAVADVLDDAFRASEA